MFTVKEIKTKISIIKTNDSAYGQCCVFLDLVGEDSGKSCKTCFKFETGKCSPYHSILIRGLK